MTAVNEQNVLQVQQLLREYGQAIRGYYGELDERVGQQQMNLLATALTSEVPLNLGTVRESLHLCPNGAGHWKLYCEDLHPAPAQHELFED